MHIRIPPSLDWLRGTPEGAAWLSQLPGLTAEMAGRWQLELGEPFPTAYVSLVLPARLEDGREAVLKLSYPHRESAQESLALRTWNGDGAVRLLAEEPVSHAMLLERCRPGQTLAEARAPAEALAIFCDLLPRLWRPPETAFRSLDEEARHWATTLERQWEDSGRAVPRFLVDETLEAIEQLLVRPGPSVLLDQDLHSRNVLSAERQPWLVIDPKPLAGEREFSVAPIVRDAALGHSPNLVRWRLRHLCSELALDERRARRWALVQTVAWAFDGDQVLPKHVDVANWLASGEV